MSKDYAMFTDAGNDAVDAIVRRAVMLDMTWSATYNELSTLAKRKEFAEALDTAVREMVYFAIGADKRDEDFYV